MITLNDRQLCENCFSEIIAEPCPHCGFISERYRRDPMALAVGSLLSGRYKIGGVVGKGGFGITYLAYDLKLDARVAVKEYYPLGLAMRNPVDMTVSVTSEEAGTSFREGAEKFYNEAKMVAKFNANPNIVSVYDFFYENETVYFVMSYLQGQTLKSYLKRKKITEGQAVELFDRVANALTAPHSMDILHRDISPDNIMLCDDGTIRLLDFGAARQIMAEQSQSLSVILKRDYAPLEQYQRKGKQGPWTDIYALGATVYTALTGDLPDEPMSRLEDDSDYENNKYGISDPLWKVISKCTKLKISECYQNIAELKEDLDNVGIAPERFTDVEEEISDFLRGKAPAENLMKPSQAEAFASASDPNATMLLKRENEYASLSSATVAMAPQEAAAYGGFQKPVPDGAQEKESTPVRREQGVHSEQGVHRGQRVHKDKKEPPKGTTWMLPLIAVLCIAVIALGFVTLMTLRKGHDKVEAEALSEETGDGTSEEVSEEAETTEEAEDSEYEEMYQYISDYGDKAMTKEADEYCTALAEADYKDSAEIIEGIKKWKLISAIINSDSTSEQDEPFMFKRDNWYAHYTIGGGTYGGGTFRLVVESNNGHRTENEIVVDGINSQGYYGIVIEHPFDGEATEAGVTVYAKLYDPDGNILSNKQFRWR